MAWPKDAAEVRAFFRSDFLNMKFANADHSPSDNDQYLISAHDFLSAINWWADHPNLSAHAQASDALDEKLLTLVRAVVNFHKERSSVLRVHIEDMTDLLEKRDAAIQQAREAK